MVCTSIVEEILEEDLGHHPEGEKYRDDKIGTDRNFKREIVWPNAFAFLILHLGAVYGLFLILTFEVKLLTIFWVLSLGFFCGMGITMGAHRLFAHKSYKATFTLRLLLITFQTMAGQNSMFTWARDHRLHHKYSDTDADPHNARRGFFFSHMGWLMSKKHPLVKEKGKTIDMSDLLGDKLVMWQKKYFIPLYLTVAMMIPIFVPVFLLGETLWNAFFTAYVFRYVFVLNQTWFVNSAAHLYGTKPFDKYILPSQNSFVAFVAGGEGWHNYHHVFPWDYRTSEDGSKYNVTKAMIDLANKYEMAYDLKTAPYKMVDQRTMRTGDPFFMERAQKVKTYRWGEETEQEYPSDKIQEKFS